MKKIILCFGTRPEAIKMAPLFHYLKNNSPLEIIVCVTAQHREMLDQVLIFFNIKPDYDLNLMKDNQSLNSLSATILSEMDKVLEIESPDIVLVHGDTTTSTMVSIAAFHRNIKVGHIEAGLRTYNKMAPFPEEMNRQITSKIADYHFAPTILAQNNLLKEGVDSSCILVTGNTVIDALLWTKIKLETGYVHNQITDLIKFKNIPYILVTGHRRESFGEGFIEFCEALLTIVEETNLEIIFPVHLNPNVQNTVKKILGNNAKIHLLNPVEYPVLVWLLQHCSLVISDSGGIQEEAPTFQKHILVTREVSERPEGVEQGFSTLVGTNKKKIVEKAKFFIENGFNPVKENPYGDGMASHKIAEFILNQQQ